MYVLKVSGKYFTSLISRFAVRGLSKSFISLIYIRWRVLQTVALSFRTSYMYIQAVFTTVFRFVLLVMSPFYNKMKFARAGPRVGPPCGFQISSRRFRTLFHVVLSDRFGSVSNDLVLYLRNPLLSLDRRRIYVSARFINSKYKFRGLHMFVHIYVHVCMHACAWCHICVRVWSVWVCADVYVVCM